jgi:hypothetical protein
VNTAGVQELWAPVTKHTVRVLVVAHLVIEGAAVVLRGPVGVYRGRLDVTTSTLHCS